MCITEKSVNVGEACSPTRLSSVGDTGQDMDSERKPECDGIRVKPIVQDPVVGVSAAASRVIAGMQL